MPWGGLLRSQIIDMTRCGVELFSKGKYRGNPCSEQSASRNVCQSLLGEPMAESKSGTAAASVMMKSCICF